MQLLQFKAAWCGPCKQQSKEFKEHPLNIELVPIDVDEDEKGLTTIYSVRSIPTMILIEGENKLKVWTGFTSSNTINKYINELKGEI